MGKKKQKSKTPSIAKASPVRHASLYNYNEFKTKHAGKLLVAAILFFCLLLFSIFKNISYPLFWADESMTAIGTERVLEYGYPKVHDGKNVFYDLRHSDPTIGINKKDDAYIGGTSWGHYYYGIIGYKLAGLTDDFYVKTGIYRTTYAIAGIIGLLILGFMISRIFPDRFSRYAFLSLYFLMGLISVSLALLIREVRYYSLVFLFGSIILGLYTYYRFYRSFNKFLFLGIMSLSLWLLFNTFAPVYFILVGAIGISELIVAIDQMRKSDIRTTVRYVYPVILALIISLAAVYPLLSYFKTFELSRALREFNNYSGRYWDNVNIVFKYFKNFELLWLAIAFKILSIFHIKSLLKERMIQFRVSCFLTVYFIIYFFMIAKIPNIIYTRYIIYLQPVLSIIIILDLFILIRQYTINSTKLIQTKLIIPIILFSGFFIYTLSKNISSIRGHLYELTHRYEGPLDYTIPYIKENYPEPEKLIIATNYEETSYMYYLKSKVIMGYTGNNLGQDSIMQPDIISYRSVWGNYTTAFNAFVQRGIYDPVKFPVKDHPLNNIPELNFIPLFNHQFRTPIAKNDNEATFLHIKK